MERFAGNAATNWGTVSEAKALARCFAASHAWTLNMTTSVRCIHSRIADADMMCHVIGTASRI